MEPNVIAKDNGLTVICGGHTIVIHDAQGESGRPVGVMLDKAVFEELQRPRLYRGGVHRASVRRRRAHVFHGDAAMTLRDILEVLAAAVVAAMPFIICPILGAALGWL